MKGVILLNGDPYEGEIDCKGAYVICCDGAYDWAKGRVRIDENTGDYDSLGYIPVPPPTQIFPSEKNFTDGEIAMKKLIAMGADEVIIYGGGGGREDHFLGNLHLLYLAFINNVRAIMRNNGSFLFLGAGKIDLSGNARKTFSLLPFGGAVHIKYSEGCKYAYPESIGYGECRGISNIAVRGDASVTVGDGDCALIIVNEGKV